MKWEVKGMTDVGDMQGREYLAVQNKQENYKVIK